MRKVRCSVCNRELNFLMKESFLKGDSGAWVGNITPHFRGGFEMEIYACPKCGKLEFFLPEEEMDQLPEDMEEVELPEYDENIVRVSQDGIPQIRCVRCGYIHDFDSPRCPRCEYEYQ